MLKPGMTFRILFDLLNAIFILIFKIKFVFHFLKQNLRQTDSSVEMEDLEHTTVDDVLDFDSLPPAFVAPKPVSFYLTFGLCMCISTSARNYCFINFFHICTPYSIMDC